jgi:hypothetical protein
MAKVAAVAVAPAPARTRFNRNKKDRVLGLFCLLKVIDRASTRWWRLKHPKYQALESKARMGHQDLALKFHLGIEVIPGVEVE